MEINSILKNKKETKGKLKISLIVARNDALNDISQKINLLREEWIYGCKKAIDDVISSSLIEFERKILNS